MENLARTELGDGWTKDSAGQIYDPDGFKWYGGTSNVSPGEIEVTTDMPEIHDSGAGDTKVIRVFQCKHPAGEELPPKDEVLRAMQEHIKQGLYKSGLTTDDNYEPRIHQGGRMTIITLVCKPSGSRLHIYHDMKDGDETITNIGGQFIRAAKTDNINTWLSQKSDKRETK